MQTFAELLEILFGVHVTGMKDGFAFLRDGVFSVSERLYKFIGRLVLMRVLKAARIFSWTFLEVLFGVPFLSSLKE